MTQFIGITHFHTQLPTATSEVDRGEDLRLTGKKCFSRKKKENSNVFFPRIIRQKSSRFFPDNCLSVNISDMSLNVNKYEYIYLFFNEHHSQLISGKK